MRAAQQSFVLCERRRVVCSFCGERVSEIQTHTLYCHLCARSWRSWRNSSCFCAFSCVLAESCAHAAWSRASLQRRRLLHIGPIHARVELHGGDKRRSTDDRSGRQPRGVSVPHATAHDLLAVAGPAAAPAAGEAGGAGPRPMLLWWRLWLLWLLLLLLRRPPRRARSSPPSPLVRRRHQPRPCRRLFVAQAAEGRWRLASS